VQLGAEFLPESHWIRKQRTSVRGGGESATIHRFGSGSSRCARAAST
jgi:hypothetical protein